MFIDHTFLIIGDAVKKKNLRNIFNRDNWDYTKLLKINIFIIFCTCKIDSVFTTCGTKCSVATSHSPAGCVFKSDASMGLEASVRLRVGQQFQDGGQTVELLLHVLGQLLVLLIPANGTASAILSALQEGKVRSDVVLCDPAVWRRVCDGGNAGLHHQLRPVVELDPHLSARQLVARKQPFDHKLLCYSQTVSERYSPETPTRRWARKWT